METFISLLKSRQLKITNTTILPRLMKKDSTIILEMFKDNTETLIENLEHQYLSKSHFIKDLALNYEGFFSYFTSKNKVSKFESISTEFV